MEPVSLALAVGNIPGMFTACVTCYQYVRSGRNFEKDFVMTSCKLEASELRLKRWGAAMGIEGPYSKLRMDIYGEEEIKGAYHWLSEIKKALDAAAEASGQFKSTATPEELYLLDADTEYPKANDPRNNLHTTVRKIVDGRLKPGKRDRLAWALYKRESYENLVQKISELVNNLVELFPSPTYHPGQLCRKERNGIFDDPRPSRRIVADETEVARHIRQTGPEHRVIRVGEVEINQDFSCQIGDNIELPGQARSIETGVVHGSGCGMLHIGSCNESGIGRRALGVQSFHLPPIDPSGPYIP
jgi:hypothetical protein